MNNVTTSSPSDLLERHRDLVATAAKIRRVEEMLLQLYSEGKVHGTVHTCVGQELAAAAVVAAMTPEDFVVSNHRGHGHYIARTNDTYGLIAEILGRADGACGGIGGSQHLVNTNYLSNGIQGGMAPIASGVALGRKIESRAGISVVFLGDGTLGEGILYETMNIAAIWQLPVVFVLENNHYAQSTSQAQTFAGSTCDRAKGFGLSYFLSNTWDIDHLCQSSQEALDRARTDQSPVLLEIDTYRLNSHSKGDDNRLRSEVESYEAKDVLTQLLKLPQFADTLECIESELGEIIQRVLQSSPMTLSSDPQNVDLDEIIYSKASERSSERYNDLIFAALDQQLSQNPAVVILGEDIEGNTEFTGELYGGAFKVTKDLSNRFPGRVRNTPISEAALIGFGTGLALSGFKPVVEIMFGDFMTLTFDQIYQHAAKFLSMYAGKIKVPLIIRTPMGGRRGYGPTHSQSIEKFFLGIPDLQVVALNHRVDPRPIFAHLFESSIKPTLVIENKILYTRRLNDSDITGFKIEQTHHDLPTIRIRPDGLEDIDASIVCFGGMLEEAEKAIQTLFDEFDIAAEIICPTELSATNFNAIRDSVKLTNRLLTVEEGPDVAGFGSEVLANLMEQGVTVSGFKRLGNNSIIPCSIDAELMLLPSAESIVEAVRSLM